MAVHTILKHADGTLVAAQEVYDAFMTTRVLIDRSGLIYLATSIKWYDNNSAQSDPDNVGYVIMYCLDTDGTIKQYFAGDASLKPQGGTT